MRIKKELKEAQKKKKKNNRPPQQYDLRRRCSFSVIEKAKKGKTAGRKMGRRKKGGVARRVRNSNLDLVSSTVLNQDCPRGEEGQKKEKEKVKFSL